jgi:hypothetical protein
MAQLPRRGLQSKRAAVIDADRYGSVLCRGLDQAGACDSAGCADLDPNTDLDLVPIYALCVVHEW